MRYNRAAYRRYEFNLGVDSKLNAVVERYKANPANNLSRLLKELLCGHFGVNIDEADDIFPEYHYGSKGERVPNVGLDRYFPLDTQNKDSLNKVDANVDAKNVVLRGGDIFKR
jgi:hypothetical protein